MGLIIASQVNNFLLKKYSSEQIIKATLFCQCLAGLGLVAGTAFHWLDLYSTIGFIWIFLSTQGFAFPNASALCLAPFSKNAGTASALMGALQLGVGAVSTALVSIFSNGTAMPMAVVMCACAVGSFTILLIGRRIINLHPVLP
jgi:DHA1 family bicyclomycin/chloramphenicol resistance-like MFS transporter